MCPFQRLMPTLIFGLVEANWDVQDKRSPSLPETEGAMDLPSSNVSIHYLTGIAWKL